MKLDQPQAIRTIFFDAGFTLLYPRPSFSEVYQQVCVNAGLPVQLIQIQQSIATIEHLYFQQNPDILSPWDNEEAILQFWISYYSQILRLLFTSLHEERVNQVALAICEEFTRHTSWQPYPDVHKTLQTLRQHGYRLGIISNWDMALGSILHQLHLTPYFDCLLVSAVSRHAKPSPEIFELALQRANSIPDYTLYIGDSYHYDVIGARTTGITPILLDRARKLQPAQVDCLLIHSLDELLTLLEIT